MVDVVIPIYKPTSEFKNVLTRLLKQTVPVNHIFLLQTVEKGDKVMKELCSDIVSVHPVLKKTLTTVLQDAWVRHFPVQILYYL